MHKKAIVILGAAGYFGSCLLNRLAVLKNLLDEIDTTIYAIDRLDYSGEALLSSLAFDNVRFIRHDIVDTLATSNIISDILMRHDGVIVVNLAALVGEAACKANPSDAKDTNCGQTIQWLAERLGSRLIQASTCSNYGKAGDGLCDEDSPLVPLSLYAETKIAAEKMVHSMGGLVLRFATLAGASPRMRFDLLINELARNMVQRRETIMYNLGARRPYIHVEDAVYAVIAAIRIMESTLEKVPDETFGTYNVVGFNTTKGELVSYLGSNLVHVAQSDRISDPRDYAVDGSRFAAWLAHHHISWEPGGLTDCIDSAVKAAMVCVEDRWSFRNVRG